MKKFTYVADAGSLMLGTEQFKAHYKNESGDGKFTVTIDEAGETKINNEVWKFVDCVEGTFNVYDYDCSGASPLITLTGRYGIYNNDGCMLLQKWPDADNHQKELKTNINGLWRFYDEVNGLGGIVVGEDTNEARDNAMAYIREYFDDIRPKDPDVYVWKIEYDDDYHGSYAIATNY
jgi:hypothetical protein